MENKRKNLVAGAVFAGGSLSANASNALSFNNLGSGGELHSELLETGSSHRMVLDAKCGEAKCGEGKCGGDEKEAKAKSAEAKKKGKKESKTKEAKCGEGKCGE